MATDRTPLDSVRAVRRSFGYLRELGFVETLNEPTLVRFNRGDVDVLASQVRPKADAAFRDKKYEEAVRLYRSIEPRLTDVERQKLALADRRSRPG